MVCSVARYVSKFPTLHVKLKTKASKENYPFLFPKIFERFNMAKFLSNSSLFETRALYKGVRYKRNVLT